MHIIWGGILSAWYAAPSGILQIASTKSRFLDVLSRYVQTTDMFQSWESTMIVVYALLGQLQAELGRADTEDT